MCVAELNVSTLPCQHRWYRLLRSCAPHRNLSNCPSKLQLEGWEAKTDACPYCTSWTPAPDAQQFRLVGNDRHPSVGGLSRTLSTSSPVVSLSHTRRDYARRGSLNRSDSSSSVLAQAAGSKNRAMNLRVDAYLTSTPEQIASASAASSPDRRDSDEDDGQPATPASSGSSMTAQQEGPVERRSSLSEKPGRKKKRFSLSFLK